MRTIGMVLCGALISFALLADSPELEDARRQYNRTGYDAALTLLRRMKQPDAAALALTGRVYLGKEEYKLATEYLERAVESEPGNTDYWNWLGLAYVERADHASFLTAAAYASRGRKAFERAVRLNPEHLDATVNLFSYYLEAPGIVGGGPDKAETMAERVKKIHEGEYQYVLAELAKKKKDYDAAEAHFRRAMELEPGRVGRVIDLARFLSEQGRFEESDRLFTRAREIAPGAPKVLFASAKTFILANRRLAEARRLLESYLSADLTPEDPRRSEARKLLKELKD